MNKILGLFAFVVFCVTTYFAFREPVSLFIIVPACIFLGAKSDVLGVKVSSVGVIVVCVVALFWVNSKAPIFGERYDEKLHNEQVKKAYKEDLERRVKEAIKENKN
ncbi:MULTISPECIES: hypothetical protein [unclassified Providencia]|uniref:hypothetical protein n=1 Tax=unclassified Providencia TaxID=2633465 RepID=UPI0029906C9E|nr:MULTISPECIES: hypothetical protein [unclassified Providencia]